MSSSPNHITVSRSKRGTTIKATGAAAQALFDALTRDPRKVPALPVISDTLVFEDQGQDFLEWDLDPRGVVIACRPAQAWLWCGVQVISPLKPGKPVEIRKADNTTAWMKYPIDKVISSAAAPGTAVPTTTP